MPRKESEEQTNYQTENEPVIYTGETVHNEKFFLKTGQIFTEIPPYIPEELAQKFVPISKYKKEVK